MGIQLALWPFGRGGSGDVPLKRRLHAWWNGYDLRADSRAPGAGPEDDVVEEGSPAAPVDPRQLTTGWTDARRELAEAVWRPGFISPGGTSYIEELVSGCTLTAAETMLEINMGTGGGARTIIARFGNYVTAFESEEELAREARSQAIAHDLDGKLDVKVCDYEDIAVKPRYFRAALVREVMFTVEDKTQMLEKVCAGLKEGEAHLILTDFLFDGDNDDPALAAWIEGEGFPVFPWSLEELRATLKKNGVNIRIEENESDRYCTMVTDAWSQYLRTMQGKEVSEDVGRQAMAEAAYWTRRVAALQSGALKYYVIKAIKHS